ncbi:MAG TPA: hypothetical protein VFY14_16710 [Streptomyces sp.]|nr:hypothetical protein [Streptomyces sp.]
MPDPTAPRPDVPARGVHVIPGSVPEGVVPPSTSMATPHPDAPETPMPPREWLNLFSIHTRAAAAVGWQMGWKAGYAVAYAGHPDTPRPDVSQQGEPMKLTEVPEDLTLNAAVAMSAHGLSREPAGADGSESCLCGATPDDWDAHLAEVALAAVLPAHERQVHEQVAAEIEARGNELRGDGENPIGREEWACFTIAASVARGESR